MRFYWQSAGPDSTSCADQYRTTLLTSLLITFEGTQRHGRANITDPSSYSFLGDHTTELYRLAFRASFLKQDGARPHPALSVLFTLQTFTGFSASAGVSDLMLKLIYRVEPE